MHQKSYHGVVVMSTATRLALANPSRRVPANETRRARDAGTSLIEAEKRGGVARFGHYRDPCTLAG